ncbi:MAG: helix-turn-helix domain-containing protein [Gammaproteobacteria bacterium]
MDPFLKQIGDRLKSERKARGSNQSNAGESAGLSRREISEIENGIFRGSILKVQAYAMSLGFSLALEIKRRPELNELPGLFDED